MFLDIVACDPSICSGPSQVHCIKPERESIVTQKVNECITTYTIIRGSYMSVHVLLNLFNSLRKRDKMLDKPRILSLFRNE